MSLQERARAFSRETWVEVKKVSWPTRKELWESTLLVIVTVSILMLFIGLVDRLFSMIVELIIG